MAALRDALLEECLAGEIAQHLAPEAGARRRKGFRQREVGVLRLLRIFVVLKMIGAIGDQVRAHRGAGQPLAEEIVAFSVRMQRAVRRVVHQDREPELAAAEKDDREEPRGRAEERRGGKECVSKGRLRWSPSQSEKKNKREHIN